MKIVIGSKSAIKLAACKAVFPKDKIIGVGVRSGVPEQPVSYETVLDALQRRLNCIKENNNADVYIAIENGIYEIDGKWVDYPVVALSTRACPITVITGEGVEFPTVCVEEARRRGFNNTTVGDIMAEHGIIKNTKDPHVCLTGKPRQVYLEETLKKAWLQITL